MDKKKLAQVSDGRLPYNMGLCKGYKSFSCEELPHIISYQRTLLYKKEPVLKSC